MKIRLLFFASIKDRVGSKEVIMELPEGTTVGNLKSHLERKYPELAQALGSVLVSINHEYAADDDVVPLGAEVALFPPVSGGSHALLDLSPNQPTICLITEDVIDVNALLKHITLPTTGAVCIFTGMVRGVTTRDNPHETLYLEYESYQPMAKGKMRQVAEEIRLRWPSIEGIAIVQRIGILEPGTQTVIIACSAAHRDTGVFEAARYGIDRLKEIVPIWKKEVGPDNATWIEGKYIPLPGE